ncbi:MAG: pentapeptide repeat-containing protein [Nitrosopumilus sp.]|nr:pentapeptide repeat-containing protein [Nitrosopumilus sp.]
MDKKIILLILLVAVASSIGTVYSLGGTNVIFRTSPDGISSNEVMRITSDQRVGIGTTTPQSTLDVNGVITSPTITAIKCTNFNRYADLSNCEIPFKFLNSLDLSNANLSNANLSNANLSLSNLSNANLNNASLGSADLSGATLTSADLSNTFLQFTNFDGANLTGITYAGCIGSPLGTPSAGTLLVCTPIP